MTRSLTEFRTPRLRDALLMDLCCSGSNPAELYLRRRSTAITLVTCFLTQFHVASHDVRFAPDIRAYLDRIGYRGPLTPTVGTLRALHRHHMLSVPFENLDIGLGRETILDPKRFVQKIGKLHRGGFCYELNGVPLPCCSRLSASMSHCSPPGWPMRRVL